MRLAVSRYPVMYWMMVCAYWAGRACCPPSRNCVGQVRKGMLPISPRPFSHTRTCNPSSPMNCERTAPVHFRTGDRDQAFGYRAQVLPGVCNVYLSVKDAGKLHTGQKALALLSYTLVRELATLGVIALVDAASNYRELCHSPAVQGLLARYLKPFAARWSKRFPNEYYQEIYRLKGWEWPGMGVNRYPITGHITNEIVYARIADGLLDRLRIDNPKSAGGDREHRHHQWLSDDFGVQELREHIVGVLAIMRTVVDSDPKRAWQKFRISLERSYPRKNTNYNFDFGEED